MKKWLKVEVVGALFTGEYSKVAATVHEQCINNSRNCSNPTETRLEKKKKSKTQTQNSKRVSKPCLNVGFYTSRIIFVRTRFDSNPEQERIQAHEARTINL